MMRKRNWFYGIAILMLLVVAFIFVPHENEARAASDVMIADGQCGENVYWSLDEDGTLTISGTGEMDDYRGSYDFSTPNLPAVPWNNCKNDIKKLLFATELLE